MQYLRESNRSNILYGLACGIGKKRVDGSDSVFPVTRMPMGLVEYIINFFSTLEVIFSMYYTCIFEISCHFC